MNNSIWPYFIRAIDLIKSNFALILIPTIIFFAPYPFLLNSDKNLGSPLLVFTKLLLIVVYPLIYGRFIAIINNIRVVSWGQLFRDHWWNYFIVSLILHIPNVVLAFISLLFELNTKIITGTTSVVVDIIAIYIFPIVFFTKERLPSISLGLKCLFGNFRFSLPIVIISILPFLVGLLFSNFATVSKIDLQFFLSAIPQWFLAIIIDFTAFITASLILREKLFGDHI